jgi:hypothetical protein
VRKAIEPSATRATEVSRLQGFGQLAPNARGWLSLGCVEEAGSRPEKTEAHFPFSIALNHP